MHHILVTTGQFVSPLCSPPIVVGEMVPAAWVGARTVLKVGTVR